jgi:hydroxymethylpyrimidine pyrophosphatase-like HAD family hydrolase
VTASRPGLPKLVATDLDGTIVGSDDSVSARTVAAFERVAAAGIPIVGVTGRGPRLLSLCRHDLPSAGHFVLGQGATVIELDGDTPGTLHSQDMDGRLVCDALTQLEAVVGPLSVLVEPAAAVDERLLGEPHPSWRWSAVRRCGRDEAFTGSVLKAFAHSDTYDADELLALARRVIGSGVVELTQAGLGYVEICPLGATKASGLAVVTQHLGVDPADVLVFGDMPNDLPMFAFAGWHRVAVANAHPEVRAAADQIIEACDDDGVARYLERLLG